jgi:hypothetical protein
MCVIICMTTLAIKKPLNLWNNDSIRPGPVGSVGVVNAQPRLRQSNPDMAMRWEKTFAKDKEPRLGSNITDGMWTGHVSGGGPAMGIDTNWGMRRDFTTAIGWTYQDLRKPDAFHDPVTGSTPSYSWHNKIATVYEAKRTGNMFLPKMDTVGLPRGGQGMRVTNTDVPDGTAINDTVGMHTTDGLQTAQFRTPLPQYQKQMSRLGMK